MLSINLYYIDINYSKGNHEREDPVIDLNLSDFGYCIAIHACHGCIFQSSKRHRSKQTRPCAPK